MQGSPASNTLGEDTSSGETTDGAFHLADSFIQSDLQSYTGDTVTGSNSGLGALLKDTSTRASKAGDGTGNPRPERRTC